MSTHPLHAEVQRQVDTYVNHGYPALAGIDESTFREIAAPLVEVAGGLPAPSPDAMAAGDDAGETGRRAIVLVVTRTLVDDEARVPMLRLVGSDRPGVLDRNHASDSLKGLVHYRPRPGLDVPTDPMYLLLGVERGDEFRAVKPRAALDVIAARGRTPLTIDEGLSLTTVAPELLARNHCFSLGGSSRGDKRVPALWISEQAPKLGWCFDQVEHTWLGLASARERVRAPSAAGEAIKRVAATELQGHDPSAPGG